MRPVVRVVGLGPGSDGDLTRRTVDLLSRAPLVRLRTRQHPSASHFVEIESYDDFYEAAASFDDLYEAIVDDLVALALAAPDGEVVYAVPGSPVVAERTVELLRRRDEVTTITESAVSVIDAACAALGRDPMSESLRVVDALASPHVFRGPGPLLVLQTYSPEVLASVADRLPASATIVVLHHLTLDDEAIVNLSAATVTSFRDVDHLTSLWVEEFRDAGEATNDLIDVIKRLRAECPWDQEQTHASLTRHLLEEAYEAIDALETFVRNGGEDAARHVEEELGDLLGQVLHHAELGDEEGNFTFASIADAFRDKLVRRHPHVFGDVAVLDANDVAMRWEVLKKQEKGRESVTDGIAWQQPAITLYTKLLRQAAAVDIPVNDGEAARTRAMNALGHVRFDDVAKENASTSSVVDDAWADAISALVSAARFAGVDLEGVLRERAVQLRESIREKEARS